MLNLKRLAILVVFIGIFFRFANITGKLFWMDEVFTALRVSGYTMQEMKQHLLSGEPFLREDLAKYEFRNEQRGPRDVVRGLVLEDCHHPPLYYLCVRTWQSWTGSSLVSARYFSAIASLALFPLLIWLGREIAPEQPYFAPIAIMLAAISPVHVVFAQQARPYALWSMLFLASTAALLRAIRVGSKKSWCLYGLLVLASVHTHLNAVLVAVGHIAIVVPLCRADRRSIGAFIVTGICVLLASSPWLYVAVTGPQGFGQDSEAMSLVRTVSQWGGVISRAFVDLGVNPASSLQAQLMLIPLLLPVAALIVYSLFTVMREPSAVRWLCLTLIAPSCIVCIVNHAVFGNHSATTRYFLPVTIGLEVCLAYFLACGFSSSRKRTQQFAKLATIMVVALGIISCSARLPRFLWWDQIPIDNQLAPAIVATIQQSDHPLVVGAAKHEKKSRLMFLHTISVLLDEQVVYQLVPSDGEPWPADQFDRLFLLDPTEELMDKATVKYGANVRQINDRLWAWDGA